MVRLTPRGTDGGRLRRRALGIRHTGGKAAPSPTAATRRRLRRAAPVSCPGPQKTRARRVLSRDAPRPTRCPVNPFTRLARALTRASCRRSRHLRPPCVADLPTPGQEAALVPDRTRAARCIRNRVIRASSAADPGATRHETSAASRRPRRPAPCLSFRLRLGWSRALGSSHQSIGPPVPKLAGDEACVDRLHHGRRRPPFPPNNTNHPGGPDVRGAERRS